MSTFFVLECEGLGVVIANRKDDSAIPQKIWQGNTLTCPVLCDIILLCNHSNAFYISCTAPELDEWESTIKKHESSGC